MKKYIINLKPDVEVSNSMSGWKTLNNPANEEFLPEKIIQFGGSVVAIIQFDDYARGQILAVAKELLSVTQEVKIVNIKMGDHITEELLENASVVSEKLLEMEDDDFAALAESQSFQPLHPSQDYRNGMIYYGSTMDGKDMIITSEKEMFSFAAALQRDIKLLQPELKISHLRRETVHDYYSGSTTAPDKIFSLISNYIKKHIYFSDMEIYDLIAVWIMGTYIFRAFRYYPYLHLNAEKGSGKTLLMELMFPISFNGMLMSQPVASTVLKLIEQNSASLYIDEAEGLSQRQASGNNQLKQILKTGFARSGIYYIGDTMYRTYSPKCFAGINQLDDVLADRSITIKMMRKTESDKKPSYRETPTMLKEQMLMRDQLYLFGLTYGSKIASDYEEEKPFYDKLDHLSNRAYDVWLPLFRIVSVFENAELKPQIYNSLDKLSQLDGIRRKMRDSEENETGSLITGLSEVLQRLQPHTDKDGIQYYETDVLFKALVQDEKIPKSMSKKGLSGLLKRALEIYSEPRQYGLGTKRMYGIDIEKFEEYRKRYSDIMEVTGIRKDDKQMEEHK